MEKNPTRQSTRSLRSIKGRSSIVEVYSGPDFETTLIEACVRYSLPFNIIVRKEYLSDEFYKMLKGPQLSGKLKKPQIPTPSTNQITLDKSDEFEMPALSKSMHADAFLVTIMFDYIHRLTEIELNNIKNVPRQLIQIIGYVIPFYDQLKKFTIKQCGIDGYTIHELAKVLPLTWITEICLDGSKVSAGNYDVLLESRIIHLSLSRCDINDDVCKLIATKIHFPFEVSLKVLNLSSNHITDKGAKYLGEALRLNRTLRYLNLAGNRITDDGASYILDSLTEFLLTYDETLDKRRRYLEHETKRHTIYLTCLADLELQAIDAANQKKSGKKKSPLASPEKSKRYNSPYIEDYKYRAQILTGQIIGKFKDPFQPSSIKIKDGLCYCLGNMFLCYLNLSYNNLSYASVVKLLKVIEYQKDTKKSNEQGLMKVNFEGNRLPVICNEYAAIEELLGKNMAIFLVKLYPELGKKKSRTRRVSVLYA